MTNLTWNLPVASTIAKPAFDIISKPVMITNIIDINEFNDFVTAGVVWAITRFILVHTRLPENVLKTIDMLFCGVALWKLIEIVQTVYTELIPAIGGTH